MTSRRGFLRALATIAAGAAVDPEQLLWTPGARLISIPRPRGLELITPEIYVRESLAMLAAQLQMVQLINRDFSSMFDIFPAADVGRTLHVRRPRFVPERAA